MYRYQIIISRSDSESLRVVNERIFKYDRKTISSNCFDESDMLPILKDNCHPTRVNAVFTNHNSLYDIFQATFLKYFQASSSLKITRYTTLLDDIVDENDLYGHIQNEHHRNNHRGINENFEQLKRRVYHPKLKLRIRQFINNCSICNVEKYERKPVSQFFKTTETPDRPGQVVHIDVFYSLQKTLFLTFAHKNTE